jgi:hypothetical protein
MEGGRRRRVQVGREVTWLLPCRDEMKSEWEAHYDRASAITSPCLNHVNGFFCILSVPNHFNGFCILHSFTTNHYSTLQIRVVETFYEYERFESLD